MKILVLCAVFAVCAIAVSGSAENEDHSVAENTGDVEKRGIGDMLKKLKFGKLAGMLGMKKKSAGMQPPMMKKNAMMSKKSGMSGMPGMPGKNPWMMGGSNPWKSMAMARMNAWKMGGWKPSMSWKTMSMPWMKKMSWKRAMPPQPKKSSKLSGILKNLPKQAKVFINGRLKAKNAKKGKRAASPMSGLGNMLKKVLSKAKKGGKPMGRGRNMKKPAKGMVKPKKP